MISRKTKLVVIFLIFLCNLKSSPALTDDDFGETYPEGLFKHVDVCYSKLGQQFYVKCFIRLLTQNCILKRYDFLSMIRTFLESIAIFQQIIAI